MHTLFFCQCVSPIGLDFSGVNNGLILATTKAGSFGYTDINGRWVIAPRFGIARPFVNGLAAVENATSQKWGYINPKGEYVIPSQFSQTGNFNSSGIAVVDQNGYGVINKFGKYILKPEYNFIEAVEGLFQVFYEAPEPTGPQYSPIREPFFSTTMAGEMLPYDSVNISSDAPPSATNGLVKVSGWFPENFQPCVNDLGNLARCDK